MKLPDPAAPLRDLLDALRPPSAEQAGDSGPVPDALLESGAAFRTLAEAMPQIVWATGADGGNSYFNQQWCDYTGLNQEESRGSGWNLPFHPDDQQPAWEAWRKATQQLGDYEIECRLRRADGTYRWWLIRGKPSLNAHGEVQQWIGTCTDIDDIKRAEARLRRRHADAQLVSAIASQLVLRDPRGHQLDPERLTYATFARLAVHLGLEIYLNYVVAMQPDTLRLVSSAGLDAGARESVRQIAFGTPLCGRVAQTRQPLVLDALSASDLPQAAGLPALGINIYAGFPLLSAGRLIGTIGFASAREQPFEAEELELIQLVADLLAAALERERLSERVRASEARFRQIFQHAGTGIAMADMAGLIHTANPAYCKLLGYSLHELRGRHFSSLVHPDDREQNAAEVRHMLDQKLPTVEIENRYLRKDGSAVWVHKVFSAMRDESGNVTSMSALVTDITARKRADLAVSASEERFRTVADQIPQLAWMADTQGEVSWFNQGWLDYTGTTLEDSLREGWQAVHHPDYAPVVAEKFELALQRGADWEDTFPLRGKGGQYRWFLSRMNAVRSNAGQVLHFLGTSTDITERVEMEARIAEQNRRLSDEAARKDEFLATLAHELRNPLAPIRNAVPLLRIKGQAVPEVKWASEVIERQMEHMTRLIDDLMDLSRINQGRIDLQREPLDLAAVLHSAVETIRPLADEAGHSLTLAPSPQACYVDADLTRLTQVFVNLLGNAVKYTECGHIDVQLTVDGGDALVSVRDNGIGLAADKLHGIFEMFSQVESALNRSRGGLGIGLALVKRLVEMHGGQVEARSEGPGRGSEFVVRLPVIRGHRVNDFVPGADAAGPAPGLRILVADDNRDTADSLSMLLELMGNAVRPAYDGESAIAAAADFRPDVVLCDIGMPGMNGYEICRRLRQQPGGQAITIIATTGWGQPEDRRKSADAGFDQHLVKPVDPQALLTLLNTLAVRQ